MNDLNPFHLVFWLFVATVGAWLSVVVGPFIFLYVGVRYADWCAALSCASGCGLAGILMVREALS